MKKLISLLDIVLTGLIAGVIFGIWIGYNPIHLSATSYVEQQQQAINSLNVLMPILGAIAIALTFTYAILSKTNALHRNLLFLAAVLLIAGGLITRFGNQPINAIVITWNLEHIPDQWAALRDTWWNFHIMRTLATMAAFIIIVYVSVWNMGSTTNV